MEMIFYRLQFTVEPVNLETPSTSNPVNDEEILSVSSDGSDILSIGIGSDGDEFNIDEDLENMIGDISDVDGELSQLSFN
jgi:hypothetical protein